MTITAVLVTQGLWLDRPRVRERPSCIDRARPVVITDEKGWALAAALDKRLILPRLRKRDSVIPTRVDVDSSSQIYCFDNA
jgi:hypothetical protein